MPFGHVGICDLRLAAGFDPKNLAALKTRYDAVAFDRVIDETTLERKKRTKGDPVPPSDLVPEPARLPDNCPADLQILHRITVSFSDPGVAHKMSQSQNIKKYDVIAVAPKTSAALQSACATMDIDVISYDPGEPAGLKITRKLYRQATSRGIHFELSYALALRDSVYRKSLIQRANMYHSIGKSANILISSGAENIFQVRSPYDIINLGLILGFSEQQCKNLLTVSPQKVLLRADHRRRGKASVFILQKNKSVKRIISQNNDIQYKKIKIT